MKKIITLAAVAMITAGAWADDQVFVLDLKNPTVPETLEMTDDVWSETYNDEYSYIECPPFLISHIYENSSWGGMYWDGFTISQKTENEDHTSEGWVPNQFSSVPGGGINGDPFLVGNWGWYDGDEEARSNHIIFNDGKFYYVDGVYVTNSTWPYYECMNGGSFARAFNEEGDSFTLIAHGVHENGTETTKEIELIGFHNGEFQAITDWQWWDLSELGRVEKIYFTMTSTDSGQWGINTAKYFCLSGLTVKNPTPSGIETTATARQVAAKKYVNLAGMESATPFQGVNIVVTEYTDGTTSTAKILK